ncbi:DUF4339 domain-containing protein [Microcoleus sp. herbarium14]|uniref:DUF4339 domain-containing protein n=1 Tax=Microcoleus sp. herbarium14 TaxID=3055439 RepID=UPI002FD06461
MNNWPKWLPYPISWIRAFSLTYILTALVWSQFPFQHSGSFLVVLIGAWVTVPFLFTFFHWAVSSVGKFSLARLPAHPKLNFVRQYLSDRLSGKLPHWREGLNAFIVSFVAFIVSFLVVSFLTPVPSRADAYEYGSYLLRRNLLRLRLDIIPIGMLIISAYLYQYDLWARHRRAAKSAAKSQEPTKRRSPVTKNIPAADPVEQELNQLKAQSGMSRMKTVRPAVSTPESAEWYVFRSGSAEGPYTRMQLLEIQKISDRTKVRCGETEWQRAGEFPELAAYLTEK